jgi:hypothetical protein
MLLAVLNHADVQGRDALLAQAATALVTGYCRSGCATVDLTVDRTLLAAEQWQKRPRTVGGPTVEDADGEPIGGLVIFLDDGYLSLLEVYNLTGHPITPFPRITRRELDDP